MFDGFTTEDLKSFTKGRAQELKQLKIEFRKNKKHLTKTEYSEHKNRIKALSSQVRGLRMFLLKSNLGLA